MEKEPEVNAGEAWLKQFITQVSHEFRTPLATLKLSAQYLLKYRDRIADDVVEEKLQRILEQTNLLSHSVDNIVRLRNAEKKQITVSKQRVNLLQLLRLEVEEAEKRSNHSHKIEFHSPDASIEVESDSDILHSIFSNILDNAIKFSPEKQKVWVLLKKNHESAIVEIKDEGIGIAEVELDKIFGSFYRGTNATNVAGMGLGLTIAKQGADALGCKIKIESKINAGTSVEIEIPLT